ncbi:MAG: hypothetical protein MK365_05650 [Vicinamibacterales bacterium]|nr:hypothetical protein [Vicinamibacterales bacterium]
MKPARTMWDASEDRRLTGARSGSPPTNRVTRVVAAVGAALCLLGAVSCNELVRASRSSTILVIERIAAAPGGSGADPINTLLNSDVLTNGGVFPDIARVTTRLAFKSPGTSANPASPTSANWVTITGYRVVYRRTDGRSEQGKDVPYAFEGGMTMTTLDIGTAEFTLVRTQAKLEQPLISLRNLGGSVAISVIAEITFFGHDQTGAAISADGTIGINFADFPDSGT